jgi:hypothetical protein
LKCGHSLSSPAVFVLTLHITVTKLWVRYNNENCDVPTDYKEQLYCIAQQCQWTVFISVVMWVVHFRILTHFSLSRQTEQTTVQCGLRTQFLR